jgi:hypothetical protein
MEPLTAHQEPCRDIEHNHSPRTRYCILIERLDSDRLPLPDDAENCSLLSAFNFIQDQIQHSSTSLSSSPVNAPETPVLTQALAATSRSSRSSHRSRYDQFLQPSYWRRTVPRPGLRPKPSDFDLLSALVPPAYHSEIFTDIKDRDSHDLARMAVYDTSRNFAMDINTYPPFWDPVSMLSPCQWGVVKITNVRI